MSEQKVHGEAGMRGWLFKWTNYIKGYQRRWFVLSNGILSYYRNQAEMAHTCRGTISLHGALIHMEDSCTFVISNGGTQTFHIRATTEVEKHRWVTALELAKEKAIHAIESDEEDDGAEGEEGRACPEVRDRREISCMVQALSNRLENLNMCNDQCTKHGTALQRILSEIEMSDNCQDVSAKIKSVNERATLFRITSNTLINSCTKFLELAQTQGRKWQRVLQHEREQRQRLEDMVEQLARQHSLLEQAAKDHNVPRPAGEMEPATAMAMVMALAACDEDDADDAIEFYDAQGDEQGDIRDNLSSVRIEPASSASGTSTTSSSNNFTIKIPKSKHQQQRPRSHETGASRRKFQGTEGNLIELYREEVSGGSSSDVEESNEPLQRQALVISNPASQSQDAADCTRTSSFRAELSVPQVSLPVHCKDGTVRRRRTRVPEKPNYPLSLWSIMKNCIGKELSKIPMPVNFSEPLSMLQRLTEDYEYAEILDRAAECKDSCEQLAYVAAFTVSSYSTTANRTGKPFNPLLGETYECDRRDDLGWRVISEQVSHHPPMVAQHCEGEEWSCWQEFTMTSKFRGKYLQVVPLGTAHLVFQKSGNHFTWRKVTTTVHNIIVGKLWVDQHGDMDIINHTDGSKCHLSYIPYSYFNRETQRKVKGCVMDKDGRVKWVISGAWDNQVEIAQVVSTEGTPDNPIYKTGEYTLAWRIRKPLDDCEKYYNFTVLACQLNEMEEGIAPTDSRFRPDQRLMEEGKWEEANSVKIALEEKQRAARKARERAASISEVNASGGSHSNDRSSMPFNNNNNNNVDKDCKDHDFVDDEEEENRGTSENSGEVLPPYEPIWFKKQLEPITGTIAHIYKGTYWEAKEKQDWSLCPNIF